MEVECIEVRCIRVRYGSLIVIVVSMPAVYNGIITGPPTRTGCTTWMCLSTSYTTPWRSMDLCPL